MGPRVPVADAVGALDVGGTHVTAALVDGDTVLRQVRVALDGDAPAEEILAGIRRAADEIDAPAGTRWGAAVPGPFDYARGVGRYTGVGKFESLRGVDVGAGLGRDVVFGNDADVAARGEWEAGAARGAHRCVAITLGTGVGSGWLEDGRPVLGSPDVPPEGEVHLLRIGEQALEDVVSRRAVRRAYGDPAADVHDITARARAGERHALDVLAAAFTALSGALGPWLDRFRPDVVVIGGSIAGSWDLIGPNLALAHPVRLAERAGDAPLIGAGALARDPHYWYT